MGLKFYLNNFQAHYEIHKPEPHILLFRRPLGTDPNTGLPMIN